MKKIFFILLTLSQFLAVAQKPHLIKPINNSENISSSSPGNVVYLNGIGYFGAYTFNGYELWKTDGSEAGTVLFKDILSGSGSSNPNYLTVFNGSLYFSADDGVHGRELWKSDGTAAGTSMLNDILPGISGSNPEKLFIHNGILFFTADDGENGIELWKTDGTTAGTILVKDINPGSASSFCTIGTSVGSNYYFTADDGLSGAELWKTDGTAAGTALVKDIEPGGSSAPASITNLNGTLFFSAYTNTTGRELWKSDGTSAGTVLVKDINYYVFNQNISSDPQELVVYNSKLYFLAREDYYSSPDFGWVEGSGNGIWKTDGTAAGTVLVQEGRNGGFDYNLSNLINLNGIFLFGSKKTFDPGTLGPQGYELWKLEGASDVPTLLKDIDPGPGNGLQAYFLYKRINNILYFTAGDATTGLELWKTDGTSAGTVLVKDISVGTTSSNINVLSDANGVLYLSADNGVIGQELWKSDGTEPGTAVLKDIARGTADSYPSNFCASGENLFFSANDPINGSELWKSDGTEAGTKIVKDIYPGTESAGTQNLKEMNGTVFFSSNDGTNGSELWKSDGTEAGTVMVKDIYPGSSGTNLYFGAVLNNVLYFAANNGTNGNELWKTDGTTAGTMMVKDIAPGSEWSSPSEFTNVNGTLFFKASSSGNNVELWKSDGTAAGTVLVKDIYPGIGGSYPERLTNVNGTLFFIAYSDAEGYELWKSDGTAAGTALVKDINPGLGSGYPTGLINFNGTLYFRANTDEEGYELWKSDGTASGTVLVKDIYPGPDFSLPEALTAFNGSLYFAAINNTEGYELWKSDGTAAGTVLVKDINPGTSDSSPGNFVVANGKLYFSAFITDSEGNSQMTLWESDGTAEGTVMLKEFPSGYIQSMIGVNNRLYFNTAVANDNYGYGNNLWTIDPCTINNTAVTTVANPGGKRSLAYNSQNQTLLATLRCYCDIYNRLVATIDATGTQPVSGEITSKVWIETSQPVNYVKRHYELTPAINPETSTGRVTLYFTQTDFDDFNAVNAIKLPANSIDAGGKQNLRVEKYAGVSSNNSGLPETYAGSPEVINPADVDIVWNNTLNRWEVSFDVTGFSGFFITAQGVPVPIRWLQFSGKTNERMLAELTWMVQENGAEKYEVEKSVDGRIFNAVGNVQSIGNGEHEYFYTDNTPVQGNIYYRIRQTDYSGAVSYSKTVKLTNLISNRLIVYPNPFRKSFTIVVDQPQRADLLNMQGQRIRTILLNKGNNMVDGEELQKGIYLLKTATGETKKLVKD
jgi:ELWxxDGT repeat protein